jgi:hypothetical protein
LRHVTKIRMNSLCEATNYQQKTAEGDEGFEMLIWDSKTERNQSKHKKLIAWKSTRIKITGGERNSEKIEHTTPFFEVKKTNEQH